MTVQVRDLVGNFERNVPFPVIHIPVLGADGGSALADQSQSGGVTLVAPSRVRTVIRTRNLRWPVRNDGREMRFVTSFSSKEVTTACCG